LATLPELVTPRLVPRMLDHDDAAFVVQLLNQP